MNRKVNRIRGGFTRFAHYLGIVFALLGLIAMTSLDAYAAPPLRAGFNTGTLAPNDDGSTGLVPLGFTIDFFGQQFSQGYVNNNGNITFDGALSTYTPFGLTATNRKIIAAFFADVDTAVQGSNPVTYGQGLAGSRPAFGVNWINVACFATPSGGYNTFQLVLIDRSDIGDGNFDIEFNYGSIVWEAGTASGGNSVCQNGSPAHIGYSNGSSQSFEFTGSGTAGYFLDSNLVTGLIYNNVNSLQSGRYIFEVRNGIAPIGHSVSGTVYGNDSAHPLADSLVQVCSTSAVGTSCSVTSSNTLGQYTIGGLADGIYEVKAFPPANTNFHAGAIEVTFNGLNLTNQNIILEGPKPLPIGTTISPVNNPSGTSPNVYWQNPLTLTTRGCAGGSASYVITSDDSGEVFAAGNMTSDNSGTYSAVVPAFYPHHGWATVKISVTCPGGGTTIIEFSLFIDPSGIVVDTRGTPIEGATVTLYRADSSAGPFTVVPDQSNIMDTNNRNNPSLTNSVGHFGWDVIAGFYKVRASKQGCTSPDGQQNYVETQALRIPPPVTDLELTLDCHAPTYSVCDLNQDGYVSKSDISIINGRLRQSVPTGTAGDANGDGVISTQDTRSCTLQCTLSGCANPAAH